MSRSRVRDCACVPVLGRLSDASEGPLAMPLRDSKATYDACWRRETENDKEEREREREERETSERNEREILTAERWK